MIKYYIKGCCTFVFNTETEEIDQVNSTHFSDCWLVKEDGDLTIFDRSGFKQSMRVTKGDIITGVYVDGNLEYVAIKDAGLTDLIRRAIKSKYGHKEECEDGQTAD